MNDQTPNVLTWRPLALTDLDAIAHWFRDFDDAALFDRALPVPVSADTLRSGWRTSLEQQGVPGSWWFLAEDQSKTPVGICGLEKVNYIQGDATLPFFVSRHFRNRGLATAMAISVLDLAFDRLRLHRVTTCFRSDNEASAKSLERLGFTVEGCHREAWFTGAERKDIMLAGILGTEWAARRKNIIEKLASTCSLSFDPTCWNTERGG